MLLDQPMDCESLNYSKRRIFAIWRNGCAKCKNCQMCLFTVYTVFNRFGPFLRYMCKKYQESFIKLKNMVTSCIYCGELRRKDSSRSFHKFPVKNKALLKAWLRNLNRGSDFKLYSNAVLCSDHFEDKYLQFSNNKKMLLIGSIPTIFLQYKSTCVYCKAFKKDNGNRSFHKFPKDNDKLLVKWLRNMNMKNFVPSERSVLCSDHFEKHYIRKTNVDKNLSSITRNAVPTIFLRNEGGETSLNEDNDIHTNENYSRLFLTSQNSYQGGGTREMPPLSFSMKLRILKKGPNCDINEIISSPPSPSNKEILSSTEKSETSAEEDYVTFHKMKTKMFELEKKIKV